MGDGYINRTHKASRFAFIHTLSDKAYVEFCYALFSQYLPYGPNGIKDESYFDKRTQKTYHRVICQSRTAIILDKLYPLWYKGSKVIPVDWVATNLDAESLAIWYQDDGHIKDGHDRIILSTESFTDEEKTFLRCLLYNKFRIAAKVDSQGRLDITSRLEVRKFLALVEPLMHFSMSRKSTENKWKQWKVQWLEKDKLKRGTFRTSIYLPYDLYETIRGEGYSYLLNCLLTEWLNEQWNLNLLKPGNRYGWLTNHQGVPKGTYLITPRFWPDVKGKLDILSMATGFDRSELVIMALIGNKMPKS